MAERVGFEPTVGLTLRLISSETHITFFPLQSDTYRTNRNNCAVFVLYF